MTSSIDRKELMNELYDAALVTAGAVAVSMASKKVLKEPLGTPESVKGTLKLATAVGASTLLVKWAQSKKYLPVDPFSKQS